MHIESYLHIIEITTLLFDYDLMFCFVLIGLPHSRPKPFIAGGLRTNHKHEFTSLTIIRLGIGVYRTRSWRGED